MPISRSIHLLMMAAGFLLFAAPAMAQDVEPIPLEGSYSIHKNGNPMTMDIPDEDGNNVTHDVGMDIEVPLGPLAPYSRLWVRPVGGDAKTYLDPETNSVTYFYPVFPWFNFYSFETFFQGQTFTGNMWWSEDTGRWEGVTHGSGNQWWYTPE